MKTVVNFLRKYRWVFKIIVYTTILFVPVFVIIEYTIFKPVGFLFNRVRYSATILLWSTGM